MGPPGLTLTSRSYPFTHFECTPSPQTYENESERRIPQNTETFKAQDIMFTMREEIEERREGKKGQCITLPKVNKFATTPPGK